MSTKTATAAVLAVGAAIALVVGVDPWHTIGVVLFVGIAGFFYLMLFMWLLDALRWVWSSLTGRARHNSGIVRIESRVGTYERDPRTGRMRRVSDDGNPFRSDED